MTSRYWAATEDAVPERRRLELLEARYDPLTFRRLGALAPSEGWSCLEVAAGAGSVARWLAARIGDRGRVVATDLDPRFLDGTLPGNVEVRQHDILTDPLEEADFDLVHCRALLCHLDDPMVALTRMTSAGARAAKPRGAGPHPRRRNPGRRVHAPLPRSIPRPADRRRRRLPVGTRRSV